MSRGWWFFALWLIAATAAISLAATKSETPEETAPIWHPPSIWSEAPYENVQLRSEDAQQWQELYQDWMDFQGCELHFAVPNLTRGEPSHDHLYRYGWCADGEETPLEEMASAVNLALVELDQLLTQASLIRSESPAASMLDADAMLAAQYTSRVLQSLESRSSFDEHDQQALLGAQNRMLGLRNWIAFRASSDCEPNIDLASSIAAMSEVDFDTYKFSGPAGVVPHRILPTLQLMAEYNISAGALTFLYEAELHLAESGSISYGNLSAFMTEPREIWELHALWEPLRTLSMLGKQSSVEGWDRFLEEHHDWFEALENVQTVQPDWGLLGCEEG